MNHGRGRKEDVSSCGIMKKDYSIPSKSRKPIQRYFHEYSKLRNQALKEYAKYYGPLTIDTTMTSCTDRWNWINEPWPWQEGGC